MRTPAEYDDYLRTACGLDAPDGPPVTLTLAQARAAQPRPSCPTPTPSLWKRLWILWKLFN